MYGTDHKQAPAPPNTHQGRPLTPITVVSAALLAPCLRYWTILDQTGPYKRSNSTISWSTRHCGLQVRSSPCPSSNPRSLRDPQLSPALYPQARHATNWTKLDHGACNCTTLYRHCVRSCNRVHPWLTHGTARASVKAARRSTRGPHKGNPVGLCWPAYWLV